MKRRLVEILVGSVRVETVYEDGEKTAVISVAYRFARTVNQTEMNTGLSVIYPATGEPRRAAEGTLGYHLRKRRLSLGLLREEIATQMGVYKTTIQNWENGVSNPQLQCVPKIIKFLGHNPISE